jgi:hypothetical protein
MLPACTSTTACSPTSDPRPFSRGERDLLDRIDGELDLIACWQTANPRKRLAQTLRWNGDPTIPYHCDGLFVPRGWRPRLASCRVVRGARWARLSDHNPVVAELRRLVWARRCGSRAVHRTTSDAVA